MNGKSERADGSATTIQVGVGPAGVYGQMSVTSGLWSQLKARFRPAPLETLVKIAAAAAEARVPGEITATLFVANFSRWMLTVEDVHLDWANVGNGGLNDVRPTFHGHGQELPARSLSRVSFRVPLLDSQVPDVVRWIGEAPNRLSSPRGALDLAGHLRVKRRESDRRVRFSVKGVPTHWYVQPPPAPQVPEAP